MPVCYHRGTCHKDSESKHINLRNSSKEESSKKNGKTKTQLQAEGKEGSSERVLNGIQANKLSNIEFQTILIRMLNELNENYKKLQGNYKELTENYMIMKQDIETINKSEENQEYNF